MYDLEQLWKSAGPGLRNLIRTPFGLGANPYRDSVARELWGLGPRLALALLAFVSTAAGIAAFHLDIDFPLASRASWSLLFFAGPCAWMARKALTEEGARLRTEGRQSPSELFPVVAWPLVPPSLLFVTLVVATRVAGWSDPLDHPGGSGIIAVLGWAAVSTESWFAYAAAVAVLLAVLSYHKDWTEALLTLVACLLLFRLTVALVELIALKLAPLSSITAFAVHQLTSYVVPDDVGDLLDQGAKTVLMTGIYLAVIGAVWATSREAFGRLLEQGEVELLSELESQAEEEEEVDPGEDSSEDEDDDSQSPSESRPC